MRALIVVRVLSRETRERLVTVNARYMEHHHLVYNIQPRQEDVWIVTQPKCGTTWTQEIVWNILSGAEEVTSARTPFIDGPMIFGDDDPEQFFADLEKMPSPRVIKVRLASTLSKYYQFNQSLTISLSRHTTPSSCCPPAFWRCPKLYLSVEM